AADAVPKLIEWLPEHPQAARVLGKIGSAAKDAIPALEKMHKGGTTYDKSSSAFALLRITGKAEPYVSELSHILQESKDTEVRHHVIEMLRDLGPSARPALPELLLSVKQRDTKTSWRGGVREAAAAALAQFGPDAKAAVPDLIDIVRTSYYQGKITAGEAPAAIGPAAKQAIPALREMGPGDGRFAAVVQKALAKIRGTP